MSNLPQKYERTVALDILERIKPQLDNKDYNALAGYLTNNVIALGTHEAFALRDSEGEIRAFKQRITLSAKEGTLIQPVPGGPFVVSAQGYEVWAEAAGANVIFPKEILVGSEMQKNPFCERDPKNRRILAVHARAVAFRFSSKGIPQVSDWSTIFDTPSYRLIDLLAKAKKYPHAFMLLPIEREPQEDGEWAMYPFDESTQLWVNTQHEEALQWFSQIINREKKSLDFAQTFARRNALKHLSGLQKAPGPEWNVEVLSWRPTSGNIVKWDNTTYVQLQDKVGSLITGGGEDFAPNVKQIEKDAGREVISETELDKEAEAEEENGAGQSEPIDVDHKVISEQAKQDADWDKYTDDQKVTMNNLKTAIENFPDEYNRALADLAIVEGTKIGPTLADAIQKKMNSYLDEAAI